MINFLKDEIKQDYIKQIIKRLKDESKTCNIFPAGRNVFQAFDKNVKDVKAVLIGQDPYPGTYSHNGKRLPFAMGLSFSVPSQAPCPKSLQNMEKELISDLGKPFESYDLTYLSKQGLLLLNNILTVRAGEPLSHVDYGWQEFTQRAYKYVLKNNPDAVFILLGNVAKKSVETLPIRNKVIAPHPSPLSAYRGFFGSRIYSKVNQILVKHGDIPIKW